MEKQRAVPDWNLMLSELEEALDEILFVLRMGKETGVASDQLVLEAYDTLDRHIALVKMGVGI